jgi:hypothetical protein
MPLLPSAAFNFLTRTEEDVNTPSQLEAGVAGIYSGAIRVPAGVVSFAADLIDLGFDTELATKFEKIVDDIDPFDEVAEKKAAGKITSALVQVGSAAKVGADLTLAAFKKALKAKRAGKYADLKNPNIMKAARKANELNTRAKVGRFAVGITGAAAGEAFVFDIEDIGTLGDVFEAGPTELDREPVEDNPSADALRRLMNRIKFGAESAFLAPFVYGIGAGAKTLATRGKELATSNSKLLRALDKFGALFRPRGRKPQEIFQAKRTETGRQMLDANRAMELVKRIDREVDFMFPSTKLMFNRQNQKGKDKFLKDLNELMFSGDLKSKPPANIEAGITTQMRDLGLPIERQNNILHAIYGARQKFADLLDIATNTTGLEKAPGMRSDLEAVMGDRVKNYLGTTYKIFEDKSILPFANYKPSADKIEKVKSIFKRYAQKNGQELTEQELDYMVDDILKSAREGGTGKLPNFKYLDLSYGATSPDNLKTFERVVKSGKFAKGDTETVIGPGSKAFRELFGTVEDARYSIYNGMARLSSIARKNQLMDDILDTDEALKAEGKNGFFYTSPLEAQRALPNNPIVALDDYPEIFKGGNLVNRLKGYYTTKDIADGLLNAQKVSDLFRGEAAAVNPFLSGIAWGYRNLILYPKGVSQVAKTVLSPITHFRNFFSAGAFAAANGVFFTNPKVLANAFKEAFGNLQVGMRPEKANEAYRELLELGVVNTEVRLGDLKALLRDVKFGESVSADNILKPMMNKLKKTGQVFQDLYVAEDDFWKMTNYAVELDRLKKAYAKAGVTKTPKELKEQAANIVRNTVPNYAYVSDFVRGMRVLPVGNFLSFPTEILRTSTNIAELAIKEMNDPVLRSIGIKRLLGMTATLGAVPAGFVAGFQALSNTNDEQLEAMRRYVPEWSKNSVILPVDIEGKKYYIDFSHANAYDTATRPFTTLIREVQNGIEDEEVLMKGIVRGIVEGLGDLASPFVSESIFTEAVLDLIARGGVTREGKRLFTDQTPKGDQISIAVNHVAKTLMPFSPQQFQRLGKAATGEPGKRGEIYEIGPEAAGFFGFRPVVLDVERSLGFKISGYQKGLRDARREFTGGEYGVLKGGETTVDNIIRQFIKANRASYNVQREMYLDVEAAKQLGLNSGTIGTVFDKRGVNTEDLFAGYMKPYEPSEGILDRFDEISRDIGTNVYREAEPIINQILNQLDRQRLFEPFSINEEDYITTPQTQSQVPPLPEQPMPNPQVVATQPTVMQTGLTPTESALLSEEEKLLRLRQRGLS